MNIDNITVPTFCGEYLTEDTSGNSEFDKIIRQLQATKKTTDDIESTENHSFISTPLKINDLALSSDNSSQELIKEENHNNNPKYEAALMAQKQIVLNSIRRENEKSSKSMFSRFRNHSQENTASVSLS